MLMEDVECMMFSLLQTVYSEKARQVRGHLGKKVQFIYV